MHGVGFEIILARTPVPKFLQLSDATFNDRINTIYQETKHFLDKMFIFEEYGAL